MPTRHHQHLDRKTNEKPHHGTDQRNHNERSHVRILSTLSSPASMGRAPVTAPGYPTITVPDANNSDNCEKRQISLDNCLVFAYE